MCTAHSPHDLAVCAAIVRRAEALPPPLGGALPLPDPPPIVERAKALSPPLVVVASFTFVEDTHRQFLDLAS